MQELSLNILDVAKNSVKAGASLIQISLCQNTKNNTLSLVIKDNGKGMPADMLKNVTDPFCTSRTTRKVGLGLPFLKMAAQLAGGGLLVESELGVGTCITATFTHGHINLAPIGDIGSTIATLVQGSPDIDFIYSFAKDEKSFVFDTREAREILQGVPLSAPQVALFVCDFVTQNMQEII